MIKKVLDYIMFSRNPVKYARRKGVKVGEGCRLLTNNFGTEPYLITLGNHVSVSGGTSFITHEGAQWVLKGLDKDKYENTFGYGKISICDNCYIGERVTILRGVTIGENTIVGAGAVVTKNCEANSVYAGVPAKRICSLEEWARKFLLSMPEVDITRYKENKKEEIERMYCIDSEVKNK